MPARKSCAFAILALGIFSDPAAAAQEAADMHLEDAGFVARIAQTPEQVARLRAYPPRKFLRRVKNGRPYYLYIDPDTCKCAFLGSEQAMQNYRDIVSVRNLQQPDNVAPGGVNPERLIIEEDNIDGGDIPDGDMLDFHSGL